MKAVLYCCFEVPSLESAKQQVFVMPASADQIAHIDAPCASRNSPLAVAACRAVANDQTEFTLNGHQHKILNHKVFDFDYIKRYKIPSTVDLTIKSDTVVTLHVFEWKTACSLLNHEVEEINAIVLNIKDAPVTINAFYCPICDKYWVHTSTIRPFRNRLNFLKVHFRYYDPYGKFDSQMQKESTLKQYGYNVKACGMSDAERQELLELLIYSGLVSRRNILEHLSFCLWVPGGRARMEESCAKWRSDMAFVNRLPVRSNEAVYGVL